MFSVWPETKTSDSQSEPTLSVKPVVVPAVIKESVTMSGPPPPPPLPPPSPPSEQVKTVQLLPLVPILAGQVFWMPSGKLVVSRKVQVVRAKNSKLSGNWRKRKKLSVLT